MSKKIVSLLSLVLTMGLCLFSAQFAQAAGAPKAALDMKAHVEQSLKNQLNALTKQMEIQTIQHLSRQTVPQDSLKTAQSPFKQEERCAETGHTHAQAKNHKGPCNWIVMDTQTSFNSLTEGRVTKSVWIRFGKKPVSQTKTDSTSKTPQDSTKRKYPPYW